MVYTFKIPEKPWIDEIIAFSVDTVGYIILEDKPYGIPECLSCPDCCVFGIDSADADSIAREAGLEEGVKPWEVTFEWRDRELNRYVWIVTTTIAEYDNSSWGKTLVIDANSGIILETHDWAWIP